jgi:hypothetical protein
LSHDDDDELARQRPRPRDAARRAGLGRRPPRLQPIPARGTGALLSELSEEAVEIVAGLIAGDALAPLSTLELRLLGGALARTPHEPGALARIDAAFSFFAGGPAPDPDAVAAVTERGDDVRSRLAPWTVERALLNSSTAGLDAARAFDAATWERLCAVREAYDPERRIVAMADAG